MSAPLLIVGALFALANSAVIVGLVIDAARGKRRSASFVGLPCLGGILLLAGVLTLPEDPPLNRILLACIVACLDASLLAVVWLLVSRPVRKVLHRPPAGVPSRPPAAGEKTSDLKYTPPDT